jgi:hypothetical protein
VGVAKARWGAGGLHAKDNGRVITFYEVLGFAEDDCLSFGKRLIPDALSGPVLVVHGDSTPAMRAVKVRGP